MQHRSNKPLQFYLLMQTALLEYTVATNLHVHVAINLSTHNYLSISLHSNDTATRPIARFKSSRACPAKPICADCVAISLPVQHIPQHGNTVCLMSPICAEDIATYPHKQHPFSGWPGPQDHAWSRREAAPYTETLVQLMSQHQNHRDVPQPIRQDSQIHRGGGLCRSLHLLLL